VKFERDCDAVLVPQGDKVGLPAGTIGYPPGPRRLVHCVRGRQPVPHRRRERRRRQDCAAAAGPPTPKTTPRWKAVWSSCACFDPAIPINVVELGLIYDCQIERLADGQRKVNIQMTLTAPACGMGDVLVDDVRSKVERVPTVLEADVDLVFEPPWGRHMMSEAAQLETGMM
jgi:metal-sulfur cluster biosynthetic enzyme